MRNLRKGGPGAILALLALLATVAVAAVACGGDDDKAVEPVVIEKEVVVEVTAVPEAVTVDYWWWGEEELPGSEEWLIETKEAFEALNPHITVKLSRQVTDALIPNANAAAAAQSGPCLQHYWPTTWFVEDMINGNLVAFEDYLPKEEIDHWNLDDRLYASWNGKTYGAPFSNNSYPWAYNKAHLTQVGWDPDNPPQTWDEFREVAALLNEAGITPVAAGMKDGWYADWPWLEFAPQTLDSESEWYDMLLGISGEKLSDAKFIEPWVRLKEMIDNDFFIDEVNSLGIYEGLDLFPQGKATFVKLAETMVSGYADTLGRENVGLMLTPNFSDGELGEKVPAGALPVGVTGWCKNKQEAADFVAFTHTPERIKRFYEVTGGMIADDRFDPSWIGDDAIDLQRYEWSSTDEFTVSLWNTTAPNQAEWLWPGVAGLFQGTMTPEEVGELGQESTELWRKTDPAMVENFKKWLGQGLGSK